MVEITMSARDEARPTIPASWRLWLWWVLASMVGWAVGGPAGVAAGSFGNIIVAGSVGLAVGGIAAAMLQWLVLRRQIAEAGWWMPAVTTGVAIAAAVGLFVGVVARLVAGERVAADVAVLLGVDVGFVVGAIAFGIAVGVLQWRLVLRRQVARAGWWVPASTVGWVAGGPGAGIMSAAVGASLGPAASWAAFGTMYGVLTGGVLVWLLHRPMPATSTKA